MPKGYWTRLIAAVIACIACQLQAAPLNLVTDGKPTAAVVVAQTGSEKEQERLIACVEDFRQIVQQISGAELPVGNEATAGLTIEIGPTPAALKAGLDKRAATLKAHGYLIVADAVAGKLYLLGSTPEGTGHAIYDLLESWGCRWYMPGEFGQNLPSMKTIGVEAGERSREPAFELRAIQLRAKGAGGDPTIRGEVMEWMRRNKFGGSGPSRGHSFNKLVPETPYWESNPEYFALRDGKRSKKHLCMTNPGTLKAAQEHLIDYFTKNPDAEGFPVALADGAQYCECDACTAACGGNARNIMPLYLSFTGKLFDLVDEAFPGREFQYGFYVYSNLMEVPEGKIPKQLAPYIAPLGYDAFHTSADPRRYLKLSVAEQWPKYMVDRVKSDPRSYPAQKVHDVIVGWSNGTDNVYFRDYDPYITFAQNMPLVRTYQLAIELPWHKELGVRGYTPEATANSWFTSGINFWVRGRMYWDVEADIGELMTEYSQGMFGSAAEPMYGFLDALARRTIESTAYRHGDHVLPRLYPVDWVEGLDFYLAAAEKQATSERDRERVRMWRLCQQHMLKYLAVRAAEQQGNFTEAAELGDDYLRFLDYISTVNPHFVDHRWYAEREFSMQTLVPQYRRYAARLNGTAGRLLITLPQTWWFRYDPDDRGVTDGWHSFDPVPTYEPGEDLAVEISYPTVPEWTRQSTEKSWQVTDDDYSGYNWYRTQFDLPEGADTKTLRMFVTGIFGHMDFFINGKRVAWDVTIGDTAHTVSHLDLGKAWSWNYNESADIPVGSYLTPGATNTIAIRTRDVMHWGGIFKRVQFYNATADRPLDFWRLREHCDCSHKPAMAPLK